jgi:hypothetical protein
MPSSYAFDYESVQKIKRDHEQLKNQFRQLKADLAQMRATQAPSNSAFFKVTTKIEPSDPEIASGSTANRNIASGKATQLRIQKIAYPTSTYIYELVETERTEVVIYNFSKLAVPVGTIINCYRDFQSGFWFVEEPNQTAIAQTSSGGIPARSGSTAGSASCTVCYLSSGSLSSTGSSITVYNWSQTAVGGSKYITIKQLGLTSDWVVDAEDCTT